MVRVKAIIDIPVDTTDFNCKPEDIKKIAQKRAKEKLEELLAYEKLSSEDFLYEAGFSDRLLVNDVKFSKSPFGNPVVKFLAEVRCLAVEVEAYVFGTPSVHGINKGRVSKLWIREIGVSEPFCHYDRGWNTDPRDCKLPERERAYEEILSFLEALPEREV